LVFCVWALATTTSPPPSPAASPWATKPCSGWMRIPPTSPPGRTRWAPIRSPCRQVRSSTFLASTPRQTASLVGSSPPAAPVTAASSISRVSQTASARTSS